MDLQGILEVLLLPGPVLPPIERSIQVGSILELLFWRNKIFPDFPVIRKFPILIKLPLNRNLPRKSDLPGILKLLLLPGPILPPIERSIQVGTILELFFLRNNIFPAFPVIQKKPIFYHHTTFPPKPSAKVGFSRNFESPLASTPSPSTNEEVRTSLNSFAALVLEK